MCNIIDDYYADRTFKVTVQTSLCISCADRENMIQEWCKKYGRRE